MSLFRAISIDVHVALEALAAPLLFVAPFVLGFSYLAGAFSIVVGILLLGLATSAYGSEMRASLPLSAHAGHDYTLAAGPIVAGIVAGIAGDYIATVFLVGFGSAHLALTASTRFSRPLGA
ncbi:MAG TPA: hypothetical protein VFL56_07505 [Solirubrobacterales bacterium]|nr:hypothetical protein [Solirubrobacterales bacterium]